jgi:hypothetical protein
MWFKFFHRHKWSAPHPAEETEKAVNHFVMRCYDCGATREVQTILKASKEVERRLEEAREVLEKLNKSL